jgi:hypothetical protein
MLLSDNAAAGYCGWAEPAAPPPHRRLGELSRTAQVPALTPDTRAFDEVMQSIMDAGFGCEWKRDGGDIRVWYAQAEQADASWDAQSQQLPAADWTPIDTPVGSALQATPEHDPSFSPGVLHSDGVTYYASYPEFFSSVVALAG